MSIADDAKFLRYMAASLTYNDTKAEGEAKHRLHEIAMGLERLARCTPPPMIPPGWTITRNDKPPFKRIELHAPNGFQTIVCSHEFNPVNILYMLADDLMKGSL